MKKLLVILGASLMALTVVSSDLLAAEGHGLNPYRTPEFIRNPAQMANTTDVLAATSYNPAGLTKFEDGMYVGLGNMFLFKSNELKTTSATYKQDTPSYLVPSAAIAYKSGKVAGFISFDAFDGGGAAVYNTFPATFPASMGGGSGEIKAEGSSSWTQIKIGVSADLNAMVALTGGISYMMTSQTAKKTMATQGTTFIPVGTELGNTETTGDGYQGFFGVNITPVKEAVINVTYFTGGTVYEVVNDKKASVKSADSDLVPSYLTIGVSYMVMPELKVSAGMNYIFCAETKLGDTQLLYANQKAAMEFALGFDYKANELLTVSAGYAYKMAGGKDVTYTAEASNPDLDLQMVGAGVKVTPMAGLNVNVSMAKAFFSEGKDTSGTIKYNRDCWLFGLGVDYKI